MHVSQASSRIHAFLTARKLVCSVYSVLPAYTEGNLRATGEDPLPAHWVYFCAHEPTFCMQFGGLCPMQGDASATESSMLWIEKKPQRAVRRNCERRRQPGAILLYMISRACMYEYVFMYLHRDAQPHLIQTAL